MRKIRTYQDVTHDTGSGLLEQVVDQQHRLADRLVHVRAVVAVASGKGGVGKSAITANLAAALAKRGLAVGAADADLNGPSLGRMLGVSGAQLVDGPSGVAPALSPSGVRVMSMELLQEEEDAPLRWREPGMGGFIWQSTLETGVLREFLGQLERPGANVSHSLNHDPGALQVHGHVAGRLLKDGYDATPGGRLPAE